MVAALTPADPTLHGLRLRSRCDGESCPDPRGLPIMKPPWSRITATDMNKGEHRWSKVHRPGVGLREEHPALRGLKLRLENMGQSASARVRW